MFEQLMLFAPQKRKPESDDVVVIADRECAVRYRRNARARHYLIYVKRDGSLRVTVPRQGNRITAARFVREKTDWIARQIEKLNAPGIARRVWEFGAPVWFEGEELPLLESFEKNQRLAVLGPIKMVIREGDTGDLRPLVEAHLRRHAEVVLPKRTHELAESLGLVVRSVTIRNQSTRWGSCSSSGRLSLNWRLIQTPKPVCDYVILHELTHLRHLNHSAAFWSALAEVCPDYKKHEAWLKCNAARLGL